MRGAGPISFRLECSFVRWIDGLLLLQYNHRKLMMRICMWLEKREANVWSEARLRGRISLLFVFLMRYFNRRIWHHTRKNLTPCNTIVETGGVISRYQWLDHLLHSKNRKKKSLHSPSQRSRGCLAAVTLLPSVNQGPASVSKSGCW